MGENNIKNKRSKLNLKSEAILTIILTAGTYFLAFVYEYSYLSSFGIPSHLISITPGLILSTFITLGSALFILFSVWNLLLVVLPDGSIIKVKIIRVFLLLSIPIWHLISYGFRVEDIKFYALTIGFVAFFEFLWPLLIYGDKETFKEKIISDELKEEKVVRKTIFGRSLNFFGQFYYFIIVFFIFAGSFFSTYARGQAETREVFPVDVEEQSLAAVRIYKNKAILVKYNENNKIQYFKVKGLDNIKYKNKNIGTLEHKQLLE